MQSSSKAERGSPADVAVLVRVPRTADRARNRLCRTSRTERPILRFYVIWTRNLVHSEADTMQLQSESVTERQIHTIDIPPGASVMYMIWLKSLYMMRASYEYHSKLFPDMIRTESFHNAAVI